MKFSYVRKNNTFFFYNEKKTYYLINNVRIMFKYDYMCV